jgi:hypothetical protein
VEPLVKSDNKKDEELPKKDAEEIISQKTEPGIAANDLPETKPSLTPGADSLSVQDSMKVEDTLTETKMAKSKSRSKIKFFADISAGAVFNRDNAFAISTPRRQADYLVYYSSPIGTGSSVAGRVILGPSTVETGPAFKLGFMAEMELNARSSMIAGLRYAYLSDRIKTGYRRDTVIQSSSYQSNAPASINAIYSSTEQKAYTSQYHFLELPVWYQLQLNRGKRVPVLLNAGLSLSYLVSTNGLVYDTAAGGVYYRNAGAYNKLHFNLQTGLHFRFGNKGKIQWSLGPEMAMDMRRLLKADVFTEKRYFLYGGITGRFYLPRKK